MFSHLVESGTRRADAARRGKYFLATTAFYGLLVTAAGVASIYAYNITLEDRTGYELVALMSLRDDRTRPRDEVTRRSPARPGAAADSRRTSPVVVRELVANNPNLSDRPPARVDAPAPTPDLPYVIDPTAGLQPTGALTGFGPAGDGRALVGSVRETGPVVTDGGQPPASPPRLTPESRSAQGPQGPVRLAPTVISGKAIEKPVPPYPPLAKQAGAQGMVPVLIVVDEQGRVVSARASGGHPLLRQAAEQAAHRARFEPTLISGQPVKVTGVITYNFVLR